MFNSKWNIRFLKLAKEISTWSKDPSTQCGAVIVRPDRTIVSTGYNGFPRYMNDLDIYSEEPDLYKNRDVKLSRIIHAEMNAILTAKEDLKNCGIYIWPFSPCDRCSVHIIQSGIKHVCFPTNNIPDRWKESFQTSNNFFNEADVEITFINEDWV